MCTHWMKLKRVYVSAVNSALVLKGVEELISSNIEGTESSWSVSWSESVTSEPDLLLNVFTRPWSRPGPHKDRRTLVLLVRQFNPLSGLTSCVRVYVSCVHRKRFTASPQQVTLKSAVSQWDFWMWLIFCWLTPNNRLFLSSVIIVSVGYFMISFVILWVLYCFRMSSYDRDAFKTFW